MDTLALLPDIVLLIPRPGPMNRLSRRSGYSSPRVSIPVTSGVSGIVRVALEVSKLQVKRGHQVTIVCGAPSGWSSYWHGVNLMGLPLASWARLQTPGLQLDFRFHLPLVNLCRRAQFDVIHTHSYEYLRFLKSKLRVIHYHSEAVDPSPGARERETKRFNLVNQTSQAKIAVSQFVRDRLIRVIEEDDNLFVVPNGVDAHHFGTPEAAAKADMLRGEWGVAGGDLVFLFSGAILPEKGVLEVAHAFSRLAETIPNIHLVIAGSKDLWAGHKLEGFNDYEAAIFACLEPWIKASRAHILGKQTYQDMPAIYKACDVLVHTPNYQEAFALVVLEAMVSGLPVIASLSGGVPEIVNETNGLLVRRGNAVEIEAAMRKMITDDALRTAASQAALLTAKQFSWENTEEQLEAIYQHCLNEIAYEK